MHPILNILPFSGGDLVYVFIILILIVVLVRIISLAVRGRFKLAGTLFLKLVIGFECLILGFYLFWGINYFRPPAAERLNLTDTSYNTADMSVVTAMLIDSANASRKVLSKADLTQNNGEIYRTGASAIQKLSNISAHLNSVSPRVKSSLFTPLLNYMGTSGYYNPFTSEAQINAQMPIFNRPFTACHEMAHQMGFGREDEANFVGFLAGIHSNDRLLKYSAYYIGVEEMMRSLRRRDTLVHQQLKARISTAVKNDFKTDSAYWVGFEGKLWFISGAFYDGFLKANNQPAGMRTYNRMIRLTMAYYKNRKTGRDLRQ
jgi:hypothetical protein